MKALDLKRPILKYFDDERAKVAKQVSEIGVTNSLGFFKKSDGHECISLLEISP